MAKRRGNNEGTIFQRKDGSWRAQVTHDGKRLSFTGNSQRECQDWIRKTLSSIDQGLQLGRTKMKLEEFLAEWIIAIEPAVEPRTVELYQWIIEKRILPYLGKVQMREFTTDVIQYYYNDLRTKVGLSKHAIYCTHSVLRASFNHAIKLGLLLTNPSSIVGYPRPKAKKFNILTVDQIQELLNNAITIDDRFYPLYFIAIQTGMRMGELLGLRWEDINWDQNKVHVNQQATFPKGGGFKFKSPKADSFRMIALGEHALRILSRQKNNVAKSMHKAGNKWQDYDLVFPSVIGTPITHSNLRRGFYRTLKLANIPKIRFHDLRHTAASLMLNNGVPILTVSTRLGHNKTSITMDVYGHLLPGKQEEAAAMLDELMTAIPVENCTIFAPREGRNTD